jgi:hypothetical protein
LALPLGERFHGKSKDGKSVRPGTDFYDVSTCFSQSVGEKIKDDFLSFWSGERGTYLPLFPPFHPLEFNG